MTALTHENVKLALKNVHTACVILRKMFRKKYEMGPNNLDFLRRLTKRVRLTGIICNWAYGSKGKGKECFAVLLELQPQMFILDLP